MRQSVCRSARPEVSHAVTVHLAPAASCNRRRIGGAILRAISAASLLVSGGCDHEPVSNPPICQENVAYVGASLSCVSLSDCPSGTTCDQPKARLAGVPSAGTDTQEYCVPAVFPKIDDSTLFKSFQVTEIELHRNETAAAVVYEAVVPSNVVGLSCSLYVAKPDLEPKVGSRGHIHNASSAIYRTHLFRIDTSGGSGLRTIQFRIGDLTTVPSAADPDASAPGCTSGFLDAFSSTLKVQYPPIVSALRVGCIALGQEAVVGATRLQNVVLSELPESQMVLTDCSGEDQSGIAGRLCISPESLGRCTRCTCQPLGGESVDASTVDGPPTATAPTIDGGVLSTGSAASQELPVMKCSGPDEGRACAIGSQRIGRCAESRCALLDGQEWEPPLVTSNCAASFGVTDGLNCYDSRIDGYGTCYASDCRTRCVDSGADCSERNGLLTGTPHLCAHARRAAGESASYLGLCLPAGWFGSSGDAAEPVAVDAGVCVADPGVSETASSGAAPGDLGDRFCVVESVAEVFKCH